MLRAEPGSLMFDILRIFCPESSVLWHPKGLIYSPSFVPYVPGGGFAFVDRHRVVRVVDREGLKAEWERLLMELARRN